MFTLPYVWQDGKSICMAGWQIVRKVLMPKKIKNPEEGGKSTFRFPKPLLVKLRVYCAEKSLQQSDVVADAVAGYLSSQAAPKLQLGQQNVTVPQSEQGHPYLPDSDTTEVVLPKVRSSTLPEAQAITGEESLWIEKLLRLLRSREYPRLSEAITRNLDAFDFGLSAAEQAAELRSYFEREGVGHVASEALADLQRRTEIASETARRALYVARSNREARERGSEPEGGAGRKKG